MTLKPAALIVAAALGARAAESALVPLDWRALASSPERVVYVGEEHSNPGIKAELAYHLDEIAAAGRRWRYVP